MKSNALLLVVKKYASLLPPLFFFEFIELPTTGSNLFEIVLLMIIYGASIHQTIEELEQGMRKLRKELEDEKVRKSTNID